MCTGLRRCVRLEAVFRAEERVCSVEWEPLSGKRAKAVAEVDSARRVLKVHCRHLQIGRQAQGTGSIPVRTRPRPCVPQIQRVQVGSTAGRQARGISPNCAPVAPSVLQGRLHREECVLETTMSSPPPFPVRWVFNASSVRSEGTGCGYAGRAPVGPTRAMRRGVEQTRINAEWIFQ